MSKDQLQTFLVNKVHSNMVLLNSVSQKRTPFLR